jgi:hypothetical protein
VKAVRLHGFEVEEFYDFSGVSFECTRAAVVGQQSSKTFSVEYLLAAAIMVVLVCHAADDLITELFGSQRCSSDVEGRSVEVVLPESESEYRYRFLFGTCSVRWRWRRAETMSTSSL